MFQAQRDGLIRPLLVGERDKILRMAEDLGAPMPEEDVVDARDDRECANRSVELIRQGQGQLLIKGLLPTGTLLGAVVRRESGIRAAELLSHVAILDVPAYHKLMFITDGGMVVAPDLEQKRAILKNALGLCRFLGYEEPKAAVLCAVETVSPHMAETGDGAALKAEAERGDFGHCQVEGPISFDLATDRQAAQVKGYRSPVAGGCGHLPGPLHHGGEPAGQGPVRYGWGEDGRAGAGGLGPHHGQLPRGRAGREVQLHRHRCGHGPVRTGRIQDTGGRSCPIDC